MKMFESIIKKFKAYKKERRLSFLKDKRYEQYVEMICELIILQIDLSRKHLSSNITRSKLKAILDSDWVYGYILGITMTFINETHVRKKTRAHLIAMCNVLHNLGIRDSKKSGEHGKTVLNYFTKEHKNKDSEYQKGFTVGWDDYKNWLKESKDLKKIKKRLPCLELFNYIIKKNEWEHEYDREGRQLGLFNEEKTISPKDKYVGKYNKKGEKHGHGTWTFGDGNKYVGEFRNGKFHGQGTFIYLDGDKYVGKWRDGKRHGQGTETLTNGLTYVGEFRDGDYFQGTATIENGSKYVGQFHDSTGAGNLIRHGQGTLTLTNGLTYVGEFRDGDYFQGTATIANGSKYVGQFHDSTGAGNLIRHGQGTLTLTNGLTYVGEFRDDKYHGQGTCIIIGGGKYVGEHRNGKRNGQGIFTLVNGDVYVGQFQNDYMQGQGTLTYALGAKYVGGFLEDKRHGQGTFTFPDGKVDKGIWKKGKLIERQK